MKKFQNKYGYFSEDGKEYIITNPRTPKPWVNVISNGNYGLVVSQVNGGFSWLGNSNLNRLTRWNQDLVMDNQGKYIYLRDEESGVFWSPTLQPVGIDLENYECRHGIGYTKFSGQFKGIESGLRIFVPFKNDMEIWTVTLKNKDTKPRRITIFTYFEWLLGAAPDNHREFHKVFIETQFDAKKQILSANKRLWEMPSERGHWNLDWPFTGYFFCSEPVTSFDADKESFVGNYRNLSDPAALHNDHLAENTGRWNDSIAALQKTVNLKPGEEAVMHFFLGAEQNEKSVFHIAEKYRQAGAVDKAYREMLEEWSSHLNTTVVETPDEALNFMTNTWLKYQTISARIWGRAAYYQQSGAYGFRDQLQDSQMFLYSDPELTRKQILLHARHQFKGGNVLHWWHPLSEEGLSAEMSDDLLWLPFIMIQYIKETGRWDILKEKTPYYKSDVKDTLLEHCLSAIDLTLKRFSKRGLPLILAGDWNDGLSAVGLDGKGESIWLAEFLYHILNEMETILYKSGNDEKAAYYKKTGDKLKSAVNKHGWDGRWFWRASKDNGELIGSGSCREGKMYLNPQVWAVISGIADSTRQKEAMEAAVKHLECDVGMQLFAPAYSQSDPLIGYLSRYAPGVRENGGVYTHAAAWTIWAANLLNDSGLAYRIYKKLCPVYNGSNPDLYLAEPYVTPGNMDGKESARYGRGGWTWYTGSAAWLFRVTLDHLIGIEADYDGLIVKPCFPKEWTEVNVKRLFRGKTYHIQILNVENESAVPVDIWIEGKKIQGNKIPVAETNQKNIKVVVKRNCRKG